MQTGIAVRDTDQKEGNAKNINPNRDNSHKESHIYAITRTTSVAVLVTLSLALASPVRAAELPPPAQVLKETGVDAGLAVVVGTTDGVLEAGLTRGQGQWVSFQDTQVDKWHQCYANQPPAEGGRLLVQGLALLATPSRAEEQHPRLLATPELLTALRAEIRKPGTHHQQVYETMKTRVAESPDEDERLDRRRVTRIDAIDRDPPVRARRSVVLRALRDGVCSDADRVVDLEEMRSGAACSAATTPRSTRADARAAAARGAAAASGSPASGASRSPASSTAPTP